MIDANIKRLVDILNVSRDIITKSSCGGHAKLQPNSGQVPQGEWYITFILSEDNTALGAVVNAITRAGLSGVSLNIEWDGKVSPICRLRGKDIEPDRVADAIMDYIRVAHER